MSTPYARWVLSACWIAIVAIAFFVSDASSTRSWLLLLTVAFVPPAVLVRLWPERPQQTVDDVMHGRGERS
jgi:hypothetical protein